VVRELLPGLLVLAMVAIVPALVVARRRFGPLLPAAVRRRRVELAQLRMAHGAWDVALTILAHIGTEVTGSEIPDLVSLRAHCLLELDRPREALVILRPAVAAPAPRAADAAQRWFWYAEAHASLGRDRDAIAAWNACRDADPAGPWAGRAEGRLRRTGGAYR
jgi:hypothetical protein